jgi:hypothetical protein
MTRLWALNTRLPSQIAQVAMWLIDHQLNEMASLHLVIIQKNTAKESATILHGNALRIVWKSLLPANEKFNFILAIHLSL